MTSKRPVSPAANNTVPVPITVDAQVARRTVLLSIHGSLAAIAAALKQQHGVAAIHAARVQTRRLRALLNMWRKECQPLLHAQLKFDLRNLGRALATTREADVRRHLFATLIRSIHGSDEPEARRFLASLDQARTTERRYLRTVFRDVQWPQRLERIHSNISEQSLWAIPRSSNSRADDARRFVKQLRQLHQALERKKQGAKQLHDLRIKVKQARYFAEAIAELGIQVIESKPSALRQLQNLLGELHDSLQLQHWLAAADVSPSWKAILVQTLQDRYRLHEKKFSTLRRMLLRKALFNSGSPLA